MARTFLSWIAWWYDFDQGEVNPQGPNWSFHDNGWSSYDCDRHLLLSPAEPDDLRSELLRSRLQAQFPEHPVELHYLPLTNILDFQEVKQRLEQFLAPYAGDELLCMVNTGTTPMRTVWMLLHLEANGLRTRLLQGMSGEMAGGEARFEELRLDADIFSGRLVARYRDETRRGEALVTESLLPLYSDAETAADADPVPVLITGESGTGKELLADYLHQHSPRKGKPFYKVNCAALGDDLLESRLFGHRKGAFTGALDDHEGLFAAADGGTLFLDEIGDISPRLQQSLLRVLQDGDILPVGANDVRRVNVRVFAATNRDLWQRCEAGQFRWDLYFRLEAVQLPLPAFRELPVGEREAFIQHFLRSKVHIGQRKQPLRLNKEVRQRLLAYDFPGNLREVENLIKGLYVFTRGNAITMRDLQRFIRRRPQSWQLSLKEVEEAHIRRVFEASDGNITQAAKALGISYNGLKEKLRRSGLLEEGG